MVNKRKVTKKSNGLNLEIHLTNRWLYTLIVFFGLALVGVIVYAQTAPNPGHAYSELDLGPITISGNNVDIAGVLDVDKLTRSGGGSNFDFELLSGAQNFRFLSHGDERLIITTDGKVGIGTTDPGIYRLSVIGSINASQFCISGDCITEWPSGSGGGESLWTQSGSNIYYNNGSVGIGTDSPGSAKLMVDGYTKLGGTDNLVVFSHLGENVAGAYRGRLFSRSGTFANGMVFCDSTSHGFELLGQGAYYICNNPRVNAIDGDGNLETNLNLMKLASGNNHHRAFCLGLGFYGPRGTPSTANSDQNRMIWSNSNRRWDGTGSGEVITSLECNIGN